MQMSSVQHKTEKPKRNKHVSDHATLALMPYLFTDTLGHGHGGHTPGLCARDDAVLGVAFLVQVLGQLRRLS
jgi:hypothetical protein